MVSCTKSELNPIDEEQEITYSTAIGSIQTRANKTKMATTETFKSWAIQHDLHATSPAETDLLHGVPTWPEDTKFATKINGAVISYNEADKVWRGETKYYWPKLAKLSFYALAPSSTAGGTISCTKENGLSLSAYDVTTNKNKDFMVAEVMYNHTHNTSNFGGWAANGVPTVFHHQLSSFVFKAQTVDPDNNANGMDFGEDLEFYVNGITFYSVSKTGAYQQIGGTIWTPSAAEEDKADFVMFTSASGIKATSEGAALTPAESDYKLLLPQTLADSESVAIKVTYTIKEKIGSDVITQENCTKTAKLITTFPASWEPEKQYLLTIKFTQDEIRWDPAVEADWIGGSTTDVIINN